jgi:hypothetical protein
VHHVGVVLAGEDVPCPAHVGSQLVQLVEITVYRSLDDRWVAKISNDEVVRARFAEFRALQINTSHPEALSPQPGNQMTTDKAARSKNQCLSHRPLREFTLPPAAVFDAVVGSRYIVNSNFAASRSRG